MRWPLFRNPLLAYGGALALTAMAFFTRWSLDPTLGNTGRFLFFMIATAASAFILGRGPGIASTIIGIVLGDFYFVVPRHSLHIDSSASIIELLAVALQGILISFCAGYLHRGLQIRAVAVQEARNLYEAERRAHAAAEELNRTKDYFLAVLSHELRGPLSAIRNCVTDRLKDAFISAELRDDFALIERNTAMQSRLITDLLDLTRISRGKMVIEMLPLDLHALLAEAVRTSTSDDQGGPTPGIHLHARETRVLGDRDRLLQVFWNLLRNAAKFTPREGRIDVDTYDSGPGRISIRVCDTGVGLTSEAVERIFHPFEQAGNETNAKHGGLGLGLAIARGLVELHDGTLTGESAGPGQGTTFTIDLPVVGRDAPPGSSRRSGVDRPARSSASRPPAAVT